MGEEPGGVNVASDNMSDCIGSDGRIAGHGSDWAAKVETRSSDFAVERTEQTRVVESNLDIKQNQIKSNQSKHGERRTSPVDILRRNFGSIRPPSAGRYDVETSKVESMLDQEKLAVIQVPPYSSCFNVSEGVLEGLRSNLETSRPLSAGVESMLENLQNRRLSRNGKEFEILEPLSDRSHESSERKIFKEFRPHFECHSNQILENLELNQGTVLDPDPLDVNTLETSQYVDNNVETPSDSDKVASSEALDCIKSPKQETQAGCFNDSNYLTLAGWEDAEISISEEITKMNFDLSSVCSANVEIFKDADSMLEILDYRRTKCNPGSDVSVENDIYLRMDPETSRSNSDLVDTQNALKGGCTLGSLDQRWLAGNQRENCSRSFNYGSARTQNQSSMSLKSRDVKLSVSEGNLKSILHKNPGRIGPPSVVGSNVETHKDLDKVKIMLENLGGRQRTFGFSLNNQERPDSDFPKFSTSLELDDFELSIVNRNLEGTVKAIDENEICQSKEHVYCTVYCIANDNYRKPLGTALPLDPESPPPSDLPEVYSPVNLPHPSLDSEIGYYPEPYTLRDLVGHSGFSSVLSVDDLVLTCLVCLDVRAIRPLHCCKKAVCEDCLKSYIGSQVLSGRVYIACPIPECSGYLEESVVVSHLASEDVAKYKYFLELSRLDSRTKACPQCSLFTSLKGQNPSAPGKMEQKFKIQCSRCQLVWCFKCHAPWHSGLKCRDYRKEDKLLRHWAGVIEHGQRNAQKCPRCKIHIQRTEGCDHMTCTQCNTNFCYRCGEKYRQLRFFGDHTSNLSVFGCKYRYLPEKPHLRRFIRGSVCVSKVVVAPVLMVLLVVMGALALVIGLVAFPVYYICKKRRKHSTGKGRWLC